MEFAIETLRKEEKWELLPTFRVDIVENGRGWNWNDVQQIEAAAKEIVPTPCGIHLYAGDHAILRVPGKPDVYTVPIGETTSFTRALADEYTLEQLYEALTFYATQLCTMLPPVFLGPVSNDPQRHDTGVRLASDRSIVPFNRFGRTYRVVVQMGRKKNTRHGRVWFDMPEVSLPRTGRVIDFAVLPNEQRIPLGKVGWQYFCVDDHITDEEILTAYKVLAVGLRTKFGENAPPEAERPKNVEVFTFSERQEVILQQVGDGESGKVCTQ